MKARTFLGEGGAVEYVTKEKLRLAEVIRGISRDKEKYVENPGKDFTRDRKLTFEKMMRVIFMMGGQSIFRELLEYHGFSASTPTASAFVQRRQKIKPEAFKTLYKTYTAGLDVSKRLKKYQLLAADGMDILTARNPEDKSTYFDLRDYNQLHIVALYDLLNHLYINACVQPGHMMNEYSAVIALAAEVCEKKALLVADRGFSSYNVIEHLQQMGLKYLIRSLDQDSRSSMLSTLGLPEGEFDVQVNKILTQRRVKLFESRPDMFKVLSSTTRFDFLDYDDRDFYPISFRVVRFRLETGEYESILTNLSPDEFPASAIKEIYSLRWGIETSFRQLKYAIGLPQFHAVQMNSVMQEIYAKLTAFNFCSTVAQHIKIKNTRKHVYAVNFFIAVQLCMAYLHEKKSISARALTVLLKKSLVPIRKGRDAPRHPPAHKPFSLLYRLT